MGGNIYAPAPAPSIPHKDKVYMDTYTCVSTFVLFVTFGIIVTRFRLWHTNKFLMKVIKLASNPVNNWINQTIGFVVAFQFQNDLYLIWVVILFIAYDNVFTVAQYSLLESAADRRQREYGFLYSCTFTGVFIIVYNNDDRYFYVPLLVLWALVLAKFVIRIVSYAFAERAYGLENINKVAEYMKTEHTQTNPSDAIDPKCMIGYKYLVRGEEKFEPKIHAPRYSPEVELKKSIVTVEQVWSCNEGLLHPSVDKDGGLKDVCLSFALFKLIRRRMFQYPVAEEEKIKASRLIFDGLLSSEANGKNDGKLDKQRIFRVIKVELGFLRDLIYTRYPVGFAFGFPVMNFLVLGATLGVTLWIAVKVFIHHETNKQTEYYLMVGHKSHKHNVDYPITYVLLILIMTMELFEVLMYVLCDWTKVIMVCQFVKCKSSHATNHLASSDANSQGHAWLPGYKVLAHAFRKLSFSKSVNNKLRQYSLVRNCNTSRKRNLRLGYSLLSNLRVSKREVRPPGLKRDKAVELTSEVKEAIFDTLAERRENLTNGKAALQHNGARVYEDLQWTLNLGTPVHTIMVWNIATTFYEIHAEDEGRSADNESIRINKKVAIELSNYCAYLVAFLPEMLPLTSNLTKYIFWEIFRETSEFFGKYKDENTKYNKMADCKGGDQIIHRGAELGQYLRKKIPEVQRWKIMADFWSKMILSIAPAGPTSVHLEQLGHGSEFITHLWALLYHAGVIRTPSETHQPENWYV